MEPSTPTPGTPPDPEDVDMPTRTRRAARRLADATHLPVALYLAFIGTRTLAGDPPSAMHEALPDWLTVAWALVLIAGAVLVVVGTASDRTHAESAGHGFHVAGVVIYTAVTAAWTGSTLIVIAVLAPVSLIRLRVLARSRSARREAGRLLYGEVE